MRQVEVGDGKGAMLKNVWCVGDLEGWVDGLMRNMSLSAERPS